jgi:hypothetical protein
MNIRVTVLFLAGLSLAPPFLRAQDPSAAVFMRRFAFIFGANQGDHDRPRLRHAVDDARKMRQVMLDMGGVEAEDCIFLADPKRQDVLQGLAELRERIDRIRRISRRLELIFYYSGHSDEDAIQLGSERIAYPDLRKGITDIDADVRIAIIDSCSSGAFNTAKGVIRKSPFMIDSSFDMKGNAFLTSSSADEVAQESGRLKSSFFTYNLIAALRGAADLNGDSRITLSEAYQFSFQQTLAQTQKTIAGAQHPSYQIEMSGTGDVVLTEVWKSDAVLVLGQELQGTFFIQSRKGGAALEVKKSAANELPIGLEAGGYRVTRFNAEQTAFGDVTLLPKQTVTLAPGNFKKKYRLPVQIQYKGGAFPMLVRAPGRWSLEFSSGAMSFNPTDLNLMADALNRIDDFAWVEYEYKRSSGQLTFYTHDNSGGQAQALRVQFPANLRLKYAWKSWLSFSFSVDTLWAEKRSAYENKLTLTPAAGSPYIIRYVSLLGLESRALALTLGVHLGAKVLRNLRTEFFIAAGPSWAQIRNLTKESGEYTDDLGQYVMTPELTSFDARGSGRGWLVKSGLQLNWSLSRRWSIFLEGTRSWHTCKRFYGESNVDYPEQPMSTIEGEWSIFERRSVRKWGELVYQYPINVTLTPSAPSLPIRPFALDLSGLALQLGISYRF